MRQLTTSAIILVLALTALPVAAGDDKPKCEGELTACAEQMAAKFRNRGWVGINLDYGEDGEKTVLTGIFDDSPAKAAGLKEGDVLVELNGIPYTHENSEKLYAEYENNKPGDTVTFKIDRDGEIKKVDVTLARLPDQIMAQWIGYHVMEAHLAEYEEEEAGGEVEQADSGD